MRQITLLFCKKVDESKSYKCHLFKIRGNKLSICVKNYGVKCIKCKKHLDIKIDFKFNFDNHIVETYKTLALMFHTISFDASSPVYKSLTML